MKLFCFTYAGGTIHFFNQLENELRNKMNIVKLEYAGHGQRHKAPFYTSFEELARDLYSQIKDRLKKNEEYALFGYSMGSISVVEVLNNIIKYKEIQLPVHIFMAAYQPFNIEKISFDSELEINTYIKRRIVQFGGVPEALIGNRSFWRVYLPIYKADYAIIAKYNFDKLNLKTMIPVTIFYSETDTPYKRIKEWKKYFLGDCRFIEYEGNHFFINEVYKEIALDIMKRLGLQNEL